MIRSLAVLASVIAEALAVYAVAEWMAAGYEIDRQTVGWYSFVLVALVAFAVPRATEWLALSTRSTTAIFFVVAYVVVYGSLRIAYEGDFALWDLSWIGDFISDSDAAVGKGSHAFISAVLMLGLWARQSTRSAFDVDLEAMPRSLGPVFLVVTVVTVLGAMTDRAGEVGRAAAGFYAFAVLALACSQLALSGASLPDLQAGGITATLLAGVAAATVVSLVVAAIVLSIVGPVIGPPLDAALELALTIILTPPAIALAWLFDLLLPDNIELSRLTDDGQRRVLEEGNNDQDEEDSSPLIRISAAALRSLLIFGVILAGIALVLYFARVRKRAQEQEEVGPVRAAVGSIGDDLSSLWRSLHPGRRASAASDATGVFRLYAEVLARAERSGHSRRPAETPHEFAPALQEAFHRPVTDEITAAFEQARYAGREPDAATLAALERRWHESA